MEKEKQIGIYLFKSKYCFIHGLGSLELKKISSSYEEGVGIRATQYQVNFSKSGALDDGFAYHLAELHGISLAKAANEVRTFSEQTKDILKSGEQVIIPGIGYFYLANDEVQFKADKDLLQLDESVPALKFNHAISRTTLDSGYQNQNIQTGSGKTWLYVVIALIVIGVIGYFAYQFMQSNQSAPVVAIDTVKPEVTPIQPTIDTTTTASIDSNTAVINVDTVQTTTSNSPSTSNPIVGTKQFVINEYTSLENAQKRSNKLNGYGYQTTVVSQDSAKHLVVASLEISEQQVDSAIDALSRNLNPGGVRIYR